MAKEGPIVADIGGLDQSSKEVKPKKKKKVKKGTTIEKFEEELSSGGLPPIGQK